MKIGILTIHHAYNFGAMLQAFATYKILKKYYKDVVFIDYDNTTFRSNRMIFLPCNSIGNILRNLRTIIQYNSVKQRIEKFENEYKNFNLSINHWYNTTDFDKEKLDIIITGSDQTFSLYLTEKPQEMKAFFLENVKIAKKISFASSLGEKLNKLTQNDKIWIKNQILKFNSLSVREIGSADFIEELTGIRPKVVLDPTLLLSKEEWSNYATEFSYNNGGDYIAFYTVLSDSWVIKYVSEISKQTNLPVVALHPKTRYDINSGFNYIVNAGPREFVSFIKNAKYVVTTSFHATVFSIIMHKQFLSIKLGMGNRIGSLLKKLELDDRFIFGSEDSRSAIKKLNEKINYNNVDILLQQQRDLSVDFLLKSLNNIYD